MARPRTFPTRHSRHPPGYRPSSGQPMPVGPAFPRSSPFRRYGQSGLSLSEMPAQCRRPGRRDCVVRSMYTEAVNHAPGVTFFMTGSQVPGRAEHGRLALLWPGQGEADNLPTFVVMTSSDRGRTCGQLFFDYYWGSGFLPSRIPGRALSQYRRPGALSRQSAGREPGIAASVAGRHPPPSTPRHLADYGDPEIDTRIAQYEMAFRMQTSVPDLVRFLQ